MRVKTFEGKTEQEVLENIKKEFGTDAVVLNIKKINKSGILGFLKAKKVEITAAIEGDIKLPDSLDKLYKNDSELDGKEEIDNFLKNIKPFTTTLENETSNIEINNSNINYDVLKLEKELEEKQKLIEKQLQKISDLTDKVVRSDDIITKLASNFENMKNANKSGETLFENEYVQIVYDTLIEQNVMDTVAIEILKSVKDLKNSESSLNDIVKVAYNSIIDIIGIPYSIDGETLKANKEDGAKMLLFMGATGVGKTTTIAKLASLFTLENELNIGFITSDTYRMGAIDQIRTYADILNIGLLVSYNNNDMKEGYNKFRLSKDIIFVDTAGRSHKNKDNVEELFELITIMPNCERFLVISLTTKNDDIVDIVNKYKDFTDFKIIFSKSDETNALGTIVNVSYLTGKQISYITNGQNVPNDIVVAEPELIAKAILGMGAEII